MHSFLRNTFFIVALLVHARVLSAQSAREYHLQFKEGDLHRVNITEVLRLRMHFPQVDADDSRPSIRTSAYSFTEAVEKVLPDGSAIIGATLDSFKTGIDFGEGKNAENFFRFNSTGDWDIQHELRDIKVLPRAQFLGNTLKFNMRPDGTIAYFVNLQDFHNNAVGKGYDYDMVHAMLSLTDSLRMGQLLEWGFGGLAAVEKEYTSPSTATEIPITRTVTVKRSKEALHVHAVYSNPPEQVDYLEGIATPLGILNFKGGGVGEVLWKDGLPKHGSYRDTANVLLKVDIDTVPEEITRLVTTDISPIAVLHGAKVSIKELQIHRGVSKDTDAEAKKNAGSDAASDKPDSKQKNDENSSSQ